MQEPGDRLCRASGIEVASSAIGDVRVIANERRDPVEVSIHAFGTNIGGLMQRTFSLATAKRHTPVSGYANRLLPNLWDRPREAYA